MTKKSRNCMKIAAVMVTGWMWLGGWSAAAQVEKDACKPLGPAMQLKLGSYLAKRYHLASAGSLRVMESTQANSRCFWKLRYEIAGGPRILTIYVSPDREYITPVLMDLDLDPAVEQKLEAERVQRQLGSGAPPAYGAQQPTVTLTEFSDFECPYCKKLSELLEQARGRPELQNVRVIFRQFPLTMHPWARAAAESEACVGLQSSTAFWAGAGQIFGQQRGFTEATAKEQLAALAQAQGGVRTAEYEKCLQDGTGRRIVENDLQLGQSLGVHGTPTILINGMRSPGIRTVDDLIEAVKGATGQGSSQQVGKAALPRATSLVPVPQVQCTPVAVN